MPDKRDECIQALIDQSGAPPGKKISLKKDYGPGYTAPWSRKRDVQEKFFLNVSKAEQKRFMRLAVAAVVYKALHDFKPAYPTIGEEHKQQLLQAKEQLENEEQESGRTGVRKPVRSPRGSS